MPPRIQLTLLFISLVFLTSYTDNDYRKRANDYSKKTTDEIR